MKIHSLTTTAIAANAKAQFEKCNLGFCSILYLNCASIRTTTFVFFCLFLYDEYFVRPYTVLMA